MLSTDRRTEADAALYRYRPYTARDLEKICGRAGFDAEQRLAHRAVAAVFPFRTNSYVVDELIDWSNVPGDPIFRLTFPQPDMLGSKDLEHVANLLARSAPPGELAAVVGKIRAGLNPHPGGQLQHNVPVVNGSTVLGVQHKYPETVLVFPAQGQVCHAFCSYCFRWAQFVGDHDLRMATHEPETVAEYMKSRPNATDVLMTGGDPMIMKAAVLRKYLAPLLKLETVSTIRIGTKALSFWPYRFVTDPDAADMLDLFRDVVAQGKHLAVMAHVSHPRELEPEVVGAAIGRIQATGAVIRSQAPIIRGINDAADTWASMWRQLAKLGVVPYYMFMERDTGAHHYFAVPVARAYEIFRDAYSSVSGIARTVRGPIMSAQPGKVCVDGVVDIAGQSVFVLHYVQARDPSWVGRPFFAKYDPAATWLTELTPTHGTPTGWLGQ